MFAEHKFYKNETLFVTASAKIKLSKIDLLGFCKF